MDTDITDITDITENFITNSKKELKYQKYKNKYLRLKKIYQIIQNDFFNITMFINLSNLGLSNNQIFDSILDYYEVSNIINDKVNINEDIIDKVNTGLCIVNLNDDGTNNNETNNVITDNETNNVIIDNKTINKVSTDDETNNVSTDDVNDDDTNNKLCLQVLNEIIDKIEF